MTPDQAAEFAARIDVAIDVSVPKPVQHYTPWIAADRERVKSDVALLNLATGLGKTAPHWGVVRDIAASNLLRTAALYGVTP